MPSYSPVFRKGKTRIQEDLIALWFSVDAHLDSTLNTYEYLQRKGTLPHILWNPREGDVLFPVPMDHTGTIWGGSYAVCVAVVCTPAEPFTDMPLYGAESVLEALKFQGVPQVWPMGPPSFTEHHRTIHRHLKPGHYSIDQIDSKSQGVGAIDTAKLFRAGAHA